MQASGATRPRESRRAYLTVNSSHTLGCVGSVLSHEPRKIFLQKWPPLLERPLSCALAIALTLSGYAGDAHRELCAVRAVLLLIPWRPSFTVLSMTCFRACAPAARASSGFGRGAHFVMASFPSTPVHAVSPCPSRIFPEALRTLLLISCAPPVASVQKRGTSRCVHHGKKSWSGRA